jgi:hypothetical protein
VDDSAIRLRAPQTCVKQAGDTGGLCMEPLFVGASPAVEGDVTGDGSSNSTTGGRRLLSTSETLGLRFKVGPHTHNQADCRRTSTAPWPPAGLCSCAGSCAQGSAPGPQPATTPAVPLPRLAPPHSASLIALLLALLIITITIISIIIAHTCCDRLCACSPPAALR